MSRVNAVNTLEKTLRALRRSNHGSNESSGALVAALAKSVHVTKSPKLVDEVLRVLRQINSRGNVNAATRSQSLAALLTLHRGSPALTSIQETSMRRLMVNSLAGATEGNNAFANSALRLLLDTRIGMGNHLAITDVLILIDSPLLTESDAVQLFQFLLPSTLKRHQASLALERGCYLLERFPQSRDLEDVMMKYFDKAKNNIDHAEKVWPTILKRIDYDNLASNLAAYYLRKGKPPKTSNENFLKVAHNLVDRGLLQSFSLRRLIVRGYTLDDKLVTKIARSSLELGENDQMRKLVDTYGQSHGELIGEELLRYFNSLDTVVPETPDFLNLVYPFLTIDQLANLFPKLVTLLDKGDLSTGKIKLEQLTMFRRRIAQKLKNSPESVSPSLALQLVSEFTRDFYAVSDLDDISSRRELLNESAYGLIKTIPRLAGSDVLAQDTQNRLNSVLKAIYVHELASDDLRDRILTTAKYALGSSDKELLVSRFRTLVHLGEGIIEPEKLTSDDLVTLVPRDRLRSFEWDLARIDSSSETIADSFSGTLVDAETNPATASSATRSFSALFDTLLRRSSLGAAVATTDREVKAEKPFRVEDLQSFYVATRVLAIHPLLDPRTLSLIVACIERVMADLIATKISLGDFLNWFASESVLQWRSKSAFLHVTAAAALTVGGAAYKDDVMARAFCELAKQTVLDDKTLIASTMPPETKTKLVQHALFLIAKGFSHIHTQVLTSTIESNDAAHGQKQLAAFLEWFCAENRSGLFGALIKAIDGTDDIHTVRLGLAGLGLRSLPWTMEVVRNPLFDTTRRRLSQTLVNVTTRFSPVDHGLAPILGPLVSSVTHPAPLEPDALWSEPGTKLPLQVAHHLAFLERSQPTKSFNPDEEFNVYEQDLFEESDLGTSSAYMQESLKWVGMCGNLAGAVFKPPTQHLGGKIAHLPRESLSGVNKVNIGQALLLFDSLQATSKKKDSILAAMASFAGRRNAPWSHIDTKILLRSLRNVKKDKNFILPITEFCKRPSLKSLPKTKTYASLQNRILDAVLDQIESVRLRKDMPPILMLTLANLLENSNDTASLQLDLANRGLVKKATSYLSYGLKLGDMELLRTTCLALQNLFAFQPAVTGPIYEDFVNDSSKRNCAYMLLGVISDLKVMSQSPQLATAAMGAYFALISADPKRSTVCSVNTDKFNAIAWVGHMQRLHMKDPVFTETASALLDFLKKQKLRTLGGISI